MLTLLRYVRFQGKGDKCRSRSLVLYFMIGDFGWCVFTIYFLLLNLIIIVCFRGVVLGSAVRGRCRSPRNFHPMSLGRPFMGFRALSLVLSISLARNRVALGCSGMSLMTSPSSVVCLCVVFFMGGHK